MAVLERSGAALTIRVVDAQGLEHAAEATGQPGLFVAVEREEGGRPSELAVVDARGEPVAGRARIHAPRVDEWAEAISPAAVSWSAEAPTSASAAEAAAEMLVLAARMAREVTEDAAPALAADLERLQAGRAAERAAAEEEQRRAERDAELIRSLVGQRVRVHTTGRKNPLDGVLKSVDGLRFVLDYYGREREVPVGAVEALEVKGAWAYEPVELGR